MDAETTARTAAESARLLIHGGPARDDEWSLESLLQHIRSRCFDGARHGRALLALEIHDMEGNRVLALDHAGPTIEVALPAGTYHVSTQRCGMRRRYTIALEPGAAFELHLQAARGC